MNAYLMPMVGSGSSARDMRRPKYARQIEAEGCAWRQQELPDGRALVMVSGGSASLHHALRVQPDVQVWSLLHQRERIQIADGHERATGDSYRERPIYLGEAI